MANHGGEALEILKTSNFWAGKEKDGVELSVILMDLEMPIMDGLTCARTIRDYETDGTIVGHVPIIAVTANARLEQIETALAAGMVSLIHLGSVLFGDLIADSVKLDDVVSKPFRIPDLIPKIEELVSKASTTAITPPSLSSLPELSEADVKIGMLSRTS